MSEECYDKPHGVKTNIIHLAFVPLHCKMKGKNGEKGFDAVKRLACVDAIESNPYKLTLR